MIKDAHPIFQTCLKTLANEHICPESPCLIVSVVNLNGVLGFMNDLYGFMTYFYGCMTYLYGCMV